MMVVVVAAVVVVVVVCVVPVVVVVAAAAAAAAGWRWYGRCFGCPSSDSPQLQTLDILFSNPKDLIR